MQEITSLLPALSRELQSLNQTQKDMGTILRENLRSRQFKEAHTEVSFFCVVELLMSYFQFINLTNVLQDDHVACVRRININSQFQREDNEQQLAAVQIFLLFS
jgi:hypothetical protein